MADFTHCGCQFPPISGHSSAADGFSPEGRRYSVARYFIEPIPKTRCSHDQPLMILEEVDPHLKLGPIGRHHNAEALFIEVHSP